MTILGHTRSESNMNCIIGYMIGCGICGCLLEYMHIYTCACFVNLIMFGVLWGGGVWPFG